MVFFDLRGDQLVNYRSNVTAPADFDLFWAETLGEAREHPLNATFEPFDAGLPMVEVFDATFAGFGGHPIRAWFIKPRGRPAQGPHSSSIMATTVGADFPMSTSFGPRPDGRSL